MKHFEYDAEPAMGPIYRRILFRRRPGARAGAKLPEYSAQWKDMRIEPGRLAAYREACGFPAAGPLPLLYPHVLTSAMHMDMVTQPDFPLSMLGAVHLRNHVLQLRPIDPEERLDAQCWIGESRIVKAGLEFDVNTVIGAGGERVWEEISTYLTRGRFGEAQALPDRAAIEPPEDAREHAQWPVPQDMGRRYAKITGDYNPIHVSSILARLFGFKRAIIHGMWSLARSLAELAPEPGGQACQVDAAFKGPVFIGNTVALKAAPDGAAFELYDQGNPRPSIVGAIRRPAAGAALAPEAPAR